MTIELECHANCDDVLLVWRTSDDKPISGCLGFALESRDPDQPDKVEVLNNLKGFAADNPQTGQTRPSTQWPLQTYTWVNHAVLSGAKRQFRVTAMLGQPDALTRGADSGWTGTVELTPRAGANTSAFFNRGVILSQFVTRYAKQNNLSTLAELKKNLRTNVASPLMQFLSGELGKAIRGILKEAKSDASIELYCALFELDLDDLIQGLSALGQRAHVLLSNGSVKVAGADENGAAAKALDGKVDLHRRMCAPKGLGHNKFVVICKSGKPYGVWTGSTNWTLTGLHTQLNNGLAVVNADLAQAYLEHWKEMVAAGDDFPNELKQANASSQGPFSVNSASDTTVWFSPQPVPKGAPGGGDVQELVNAVKAAQEGILFVMFMPGQEPLNSILQRQQAGLYVRGVVSTLPMGTKDKPSSTYQIMNGAGYQQYKLEVVQPEGATAAGDFVNEFTRQEFLHDVGFAITHSKVIVIDPFGKNPVVVTGSNNFSASASGKNDENLIFIRNCPELAKAYAVNCASIYKHYRYPAAQHDAAKSRSKGVDANAGYLRTNDMWQQAAQTADTQADVLFWSQR